MPQGVHMSQIILAVRHTRPLTSVSDFEVAVQDQSLHASGGSCRLKVRSGSKEVFFSNGTEQFYFYQSEIQRTRWLEQLDRLQKKSNLPSGWKGFFGHPPTAVFAPECKSWYNELTSWQDEVDALSSSEPELKGFAQTYLFFRRAFDLGQDQGLVLFE